jgi:hypothetical protein
MSENLRLFRPSFNQIALLAGIAVCAVGYAMTLRYYAIEYSPVALACDSGGGYWICPSRKIALAFSQAGAFGIIAVAAAVLALLRPAVVFWAIGLLAAGFGLVLYNTASSALAVALLLFSLSRPAPEPE